MKYYTFGAIMGQYATLSVRHYGGVSAAIDIAITLLVALLIGFVMSKVFP